MENSFRFFKNTACKYFPCHKTNNTEDFNSLFCFCPLFLTGEKCGGNFKYSGKKRVKDCSDCLLPHTPEHYDVICAKFKGLAEKPPFGIFKRN